MDLADVASRSNEQNAHFHVSVQLGVRLAILKSNGIDSLLKNSVQNVLNFSTGQYGDNSRDKTAAMSSPF